MFPLTFEVKKSWEQLWVRAWENADQPLGLSRAAAAYAVQLPWRSGQPQHLSQKSSAMKRLWSQMPEKAFGSKRLLPVCWKNQLLSAIARLSMLVLLMVSDPHWLLTSPAISSYGEAEWVEDWDTLPAGWGDQPGPPAGGHCTLPWRKPAAPGCWCWPCCCTIKGFLSFFKALFKGIPILFKGLF